MILQSVSTAFVSLGFPTLLGFVSSRLLCLSPRIFVIECNSKEILLALFRFIKSIKLFVLELIAHHFELYVIQFTSVNIRVNIELPRNRLNAHR